MRCPWPKNDPLMIAYHDTEWGVPLHDDLKLFEFIVLDGFQAGLSWQIILRKRENMRKTFDGFDPSIISQYDETKVADLLNDSRIIRNKAKINGMITNAKSFLKVQAEFGTFDKYIWQFVNFKPIINQWKELRDLPVSTPESDAMSKGLVKRGFKFVGSTICYAFMQAAGMVNDHLVDCRFRSIH
jgi:DNA-3-methyladenine glycosylase I